MQRRVVIYETCLRAEDPALSRLIEDGFELVHCRAVEDLVERVVETRPSAVICQVRPDNEQDLGMLKLLRRVAPTMPLIMLSNEGSLDTQRLMASLRPTYYAVLPVDPDELRDALRGALGHAGGIP